MIGGRGASLAGRLRNRAGRVAAHRWRIRPDRSQDEPIILGGSPRSGTTLLRRLLDEHPEISCGPESDILLPSRIVPDRLALDYGIDRIGVRELLAGSRSQTVFVEGFFARVLDGQGKRRWAEKTPLNVAHLDWILEHFPRARFVHVVRDGRDVVCSMRSHPIRRFVDGEWQRVPQNRSVADGIAAWRRLVEAGLRHRHDPRVLEVRYENLVADPGGAMAEVLAFVGEGTDSGASRRPSLVPMPAGVETPVAELDSRGAISGERVGRWRRDLNDDERRTVKRVANDLLVRLGYAADAEW